MPGYWSFANGVQICICCRKNNGKKGNSLTVTFLIAKNLHGYLSLSSLLLQLLDSWHSFSMSASAKLVPTFLAYLFV